MASDLDPVTAALTSSAQKALIIDKRFVALIDASDLRADDPNLSQKVTAKIEAVRKDKPHWFHSPLNADMSTNEIATELRRRYGEDSTDGQFQAFMASKPNTDDVIQALETGDYRC